MDIRERSLFVRSTERALALFLLVFGIDWYAETHGFDYTDSGYWSYSSRVPTRSIELEIEELGIIQVTQYLDDRRYMKVRLKEVWEYPQDQEEYQKVLAGAEAWVLPEDEARPGDRVQVSEIWLSREICNWYFGFQYDHPKEVKVINGLPVCLQLSRKV